MERLDQRDPEELRRRNMVLRRVAYIASAFAIAISSAVATALISGGDGFPRALLFVFEMKMNAAIGFGSAAIGLFALQRGLRGLSTLGALIPLFIGCWTLLEYAGVRLTIDEVFVRDWYGQSKPHPGRIAPNTAAILILLGVTVLTLSFIKNRHFRIVSAQFLPLAIVALAIEALAGHIGKSDFALSWWAPQAMSVPSGICSLLLAAGLLANGWQSETAKISHLPVWVPLAYGSVVALIDVYTPLEVNAGILYIPLVLFALWFDRAHIAILFAAISSLLILLGLLASPRGLIPIEIVLVNRSLAIGSVWLVAALVYRQHFVKRRLRQSEHHFSVAQQIAAVGSFELHFSRMELRASEAFAAMHGLGPDRIIEWSSFLRNWIPPEDRPGIEDMVSGARAGARSRDLEYSFLRPDGTVRSGLMHCDLLSTRREILQGSSASSTTPPRFVARNCNRPI
ncbi:hypothetical protein AB2M62_00025 [Sphingomonas sp. MMS12-HWE2-04]|uniref:hypothetical protein n=1 Tax=Sphingomonas sp. MMS12-HWE2-04 TaxID=3234199 RepID=UPI00384AE877